MMMCLNEQSLASAEDQQLQSTETVLLTLARGLLVG